MTDTTRQWLAGAAGRLTEPGTEDLPEDVQRRITELASRADSRGLVWLDCPACELGSGPHTPAEAGQLAGTHDDLIHRGRPTALLVPGGGAA
jgi:hypothetical protein